MHCLYCGKDVPQLPGKREKLYCNNVCKQLAYRKRKQGSSVTYSRVQEHTYTEMLTELVELREKVHDQETALLAAREELNAQVRFLSGQLTKARQTIEALTREHEGQMQEIDQRDQVIADLKYQLNIEYRYFLDTQSRGFKSWLKKQSPNPFIQKMVTEKLFPPQSSRSRYESILRFQMKCSDEEMKMFENLWKAMLLQS